jgi:hypothetical protein
MKEVEHKNLSQFLPLLASLFLGSNTARDVKECRDILSFLLFSPPAVL